MVERGLKVKGTLMGDLIMLETSFDLVSSAISRALKRSDLEAEVEGSSLRDLFIRRVLRVSG